MKWNIMRRHFKFYIYFFKETHLLIVGWRIFFLRQIYNHNKLNYMSRSWLIPRKLYVCGGVACSADDKGLFLKEKKNGCVDICKFWSFFYSIYANKYVYWKAICHILELGQRFLTFFVCLNKIWNFRSRVCLIKLIKTRK